MTPNHHDIEELLRGGEIPPPPADLLERLEADIPENLEELARISTDASDPSSGRESTADGGEARQSDAPTSPESRVPSGTPWRTLAAILAVAALAGVFWFQNRGALRPEVVLPIEESPVEPTEIPSSEFASSAPAREGLGDPSAGTAPETGDTPVAALEEVVEGPRSAETENLGPRTLAPPERESTIHRSGDVEEAQDSASAALAAPTPRADPPAMSEPEFEAPVEPPRPAPPRARRERGPTGTLVGIVLDSSGAPLPGVTVAATSPNLQGSRVTATGGDGRYRFALLPTGPYEVRYELEGFSTAVRSLEVPAGLAKVAETVLDLGTVMEEIVTSTAPSVTSTHSSSATYGDVTHDRSSGVDASTAVSARTARRRTTPSPSWVMARRWPGRAANPNDAPYGDVFFESAGVHPFVDTEDDRLSTFGLDVDTASWTVVRRYLEDGHLPPAEAVRVEEIVNSFPGSDAPPRSGDFAVRVEGAPSIYGPNDRTWMLRIGIRGREIADEDRPPSDLIFVVDVSGSMDRENRLGLVRRSLGLLLDQLGEGDRVALVVYGSRGAVLLEPTADHEQIREAVDRLRPEGSTNALEGLSLAYDLAARTRRDGAAQRIVLCSDGVANVGETSAEAILSEVRGPENREVELTTVGFGMGNYNDVLMEKLANTGDGRYAYVDRIEEARRIFVEELTGTLHTIARQARAQVDFDPEIVERWRLLGYENRDIADERFRDDSIDAGEIGAGHSVTVLYEVKLRRKPRPGQSLGTVHLRWESVAGGEFVEIAQPIRGADLARKWEKTSTDFRLAALAAETAEVLKRSYWARDADLDDVFRRLQAVSAERAGDRRVAELVYLVGRTIELRDPPGPGNPWIR